jgi:hypothetical protein
MSDRLVTAIVSVLAAIIGVAILAVLIRKGSLTTKLIQDSTGAFADVLTKAVNPTGSSTYFNFTNTFQQFSNY